MECDRNEEVHEKEKFSVNDQRHQPWCFLYYSSVLVCVTSIVFTPLLAFYLTLGPLAYVLGLWKWSSKDFLKELKDEDARAAEKAKAAFATCDALDEKLDLSQTMGRPPYVALIFSGGVNASLQYFGQMYFLKKHGLISASTKVYGCSAGAPSAALAVAVADSEEIPSDVKSPLFVALQRMASAHLVLKKHALRILYMGPYYVVYAMRAVTDGLCELLKEHWPPLAGSRLQIALCKPFSSKTLWMFGDFKSAEEMCEVLLASQVWPMLHAGAPWVRIRGSFIADGGFSNLIPTPAAEPRFVVKTSDETSTSLASSKEDVIEQFKAGYLAAYRRLGEASLANKQAYRPSALPRSKSIRIVASQTIKLSWLRGIFDSIRRLPGRLVGSGASKSE